ncbi:MAG: uracil-DNA glycosylase [Victivallaceae bacterium]|nr:uracil-DNA glycosylase [Victivallaceae bacterium]
MKLTDAIPDDWKELLKTELESDWFGELQSFLDEEWQNETVYPAAEKIFDALSLTPLSEVKVLILGQDPYHGEGQAHGLCFSVPDGIKIPPSLRNIYKEMRADLNINTPDSGCLESWAQQGVLMLNTVLTVRSGEAQSHQKRGWEKFTDAVIKQVSDKAKASVFVLWGGSAQKKVPLIDDKRHQVICGVHPSPLSASRGFLGSRPFSKINEALKSLDREPMVWDSIVSQAEFNF